MQIYISDFLIIKCNLFLILQDINETDCERSTLGSHC